MKHVDRLCAGEHAAANHTGHAAGMRPLRTDLTAEMHSGFTALRNRCGMNCGVRIRWLELPVMRRWYADALQETWRDPEHEREAEQSGTLLQDLRVPAG